MSGEVATPSHWSVNSAEIAKLANWGGGVSNILRPTQIQFMKPTPFESKELNIFNGGLGMVVSAYNPCSLKVVAGRSRVQGYLQLQREF